MESEKIVYDGLMAKYGKSNQILKAIEEMSELTKELCKLLCVPCDPTLEGSRMMSIAEEIADVEIMTAQLKRAMCLNKTVEHFKIEKLKKIEYILSNG